MTRLPFFLLLFTPSAARAAAGGTQIFNIPNPLKFDTLTDLLNAVITFLVTIGAPLATIMIIYGGLSYIFAAGNTEKLSHARSILLWTAVGYAVLVAAKGILAVINSVLGV